MPGDHHIQTEAIPAITRGNYGMTAELKMTRNSPFIFNSFF